MYGTRRLSNASRRIILCIPYTKWRTLIPHTVARQSCPPTIICARHPSLLRCALCSVQCFGAVLCALCSSGCTVPLWSRTKRHQTAAGQISNHDAEWLLSDFLLTALYCRCCIIHEAANGKASNQQLRNRTRIFTNSCHATGPIMRRPDLTTLSTGRLEVEHTRVLNCFFENCRLGQELFYNVKAITWWTLSAPLPTCAISSVFSYLYGAWEFRTVP